ncbi:hypothetical protein [Phenylobacterium sp.]|uniref:hypothetical protein n=1 Tax=Phenylobacterium sp. TaxID=1871053 RepID=UPI00272F8766|nr:hypothetical protein [Phenylobacterium sp.]MDP1617484.1 hypothetical protein [Phenylobacterium sp.]MDP1986778.1 hypothetical protein [Phenylobacterium sp.]
MATQVIVTTTPGQMVAEGRTIVITGVEGPQGHSSGSVDGPSGAVDGHVAVFDGALGTRIRDGGYVPESTANKGVAGGYAALGSDGKVPTSQLPASVLGGLNYQGPWDAAANLPALPAAAAGNKGHYYKVATAGGTVIDGTGDWQMGDWIVSNGLAWDKIDNTDQVVSVVGLQGAISRAALKVALAYDKADVGLANANNTADLDKPVSNAVRAELDVLSALFQEATATTLDLEEVEISARAHILSAADDRKLLVFTHDERAVCYVDTLPPGFTCGVLMAGEAPVQVRPGLGQAVAPDDLLVLTSRYRFGVIRRLTASIAVLHGGEAGLPADPIERALFTTVEASGLAALLLL